MKHTKKKYIDRKSKLNESHVLPNIMRCVSAEPCSSSHRHMESRFAYKLTNNINDITILDALILPNDICVIQPPRMDEASMSSSTSHILRSKLNIHLNHDQISGKFKKQAPKIIAGDNIIDVSYEDGRCVSYRSPIGGKLLEIHDQLIKVDPSSHITTWDHIDYICIILPNTKIPSIYGNIRTYDDLIAEMDRKKKDRSCYAWKQGLCNRGDSCKFLHTEQDEIIMPISSESHSYPQTSLSLSDEAWDERSVDEDEDVTESHKKQRVD